MTPNELRIGNYVEFEGKLYQLASINSDNTIRLKSDDKTHKNYSYGSIGCYAFRELNPIQLTEEWLLKFGFDYDSDIALYSKSGYDVCINDDNSISYYLGEYGSWYKNITHVHQLQNLYFALTNEELTLKP